MKEYTYWAIEMWRDGAALSTSVKLSTDIEEAQEFLRLFEVFARFIVPSMTFRAWRP